MTHLAVAAMASFILSFGFSDVPGSEQIIVVSLQTESCPDAKPTSVQPKPKNVRDTSALNSSPVICGSVSLDDEEQPRCDLQLIA